VKRVVTWVAAGVMAARVVVIFLIALSHGFVIKGGEHRNVDVLIFGACTRARRAGME
jgi:hypothetical protein